MSIERRVQLVEQLFRKLEEENVQFEQSSSISCVSGGGKAVLIQILKLRY